MGNKIPFAGKIGRSNTSKTGGALVDAYEVSGHNNFATRADLFTIKDFPFRLSNGDTLDETALGWVAYVRDWDGEGNGCYVKLIDITKIDTVDGWKEFSVFSEDDIKSLSVAMLYKGDVSTYADLPTSGNDVGYTYRVLADYEFVNNSIDCVYPAGTCFTWGGTSWVSLGGYFELLSETDVDNFKNE